MGGIKAIKIFTEDPDGYIQYIWDLTDYAPESDQEWWKGQVNFNTHRLMFEVNHGSNESQNGFAALDSIKFDYSQPSCDVEPPGAAVSPTEPPETSTYVPPGRTETSQQSELTSSLQKSSATSSSPTFVIFKCPDLRTSTSL